MTLVTQALRRTPEVNRCRGSRAQVCLHLFFTGRLKKLVKKACDSAVWERSHSPYAFHIENSTWNVREKWMQTVPSWAIMSTYRYASNFNMYNTSENRRVYLLISSANKLPFEANLVFHFAFRGTIHHVLHRTRHHWNRPRLSKNQISKF